MSQTGILIHILRPLVTAEDSYKRLNWLIVLRGMSSWKIKKMKLKRAVLENLREPQRFQLNSEVKT